MVGKGGTPLSKLEAAIREFLSREERRVDLKRLRAVIDDLKLAIDSPRRTVTAEDTEEEE